ncbi:pyocin knob domain-containing protein [Erwinia sp. HR93]|uniref:pyocin knob domain-containing protein n=1 Tax=Erwinia sp. HR93 TaxID=3094840 RepID=UPI002ADEAAA9|nr:pyocin knob domain-containing protein [Erwinia sp. HR93]MEA1064756.1 pyocin knob domain-containing protein [Erwinia sp. HR93]
MATGKRPDGEVFASGAKEGEVQEFPALSRGWGVTVDGQDATGSSVTEPTNGIPPMEWFNRVQQRTDESILWLLQNAIPEWEAGTWPQKAVVIHDNVVYRAARETSAEPNKNDGNWTPLFPVENLDGRYVFQSTKVNGHPLNADVNVTSQDIFNKQAVGIGNAADLNIYTTPGLYYQPQNSQAQTGKNYPEAQAGSLEIYKHAGITQIYRLYGNSRSYIRALYGGVWSEWAKQYDTANKPTAEDTGAVAKNGDTMTGLLTINNNDAGLVLKPVATGRVSYILGRNLSGSSDWNVGRTGNTGVALSNYVGGTSVQILDDGSVRINGGSSTATIRVQGDLNPTSFNTFDGRYNLKNTASKAINGWHKDSSTGIIRQWGIVNVTDNAIVTANFPIPFPGACASMNVTPISQAANSSAEIISAYGKAISNSQMRVAACANWDNHGISGVYFEATGY